MGENFYDDIALDYDRIIGWERRLGTERPWFENLWKRFHTRSVLDAACGTGRHLSVFAEMGLDVMGSDVSPVMTTQAMKHVREAGLSVQVSVSSWAELPRKIGRTFDAVLCIGNSLPYVTDRRTLEESLRGLWSRVSPGGILIIQMKNFHKLRREGTRFLPIVSTNQPHETVALRIYDYHTDRIDFNVILLDKIAGEWQDRHQATPLRPYEAKDLVPFLSGLGAGVSIYGSLALDDFADQQSPDFVILAERVQEQTD